MMDWFVFNFKDYFIWRNLDQESDNIDSCILLILDPSSNRLRGNLMIHTQPQSLVALWNTNTKVINQDVHWHDSSSHLPRFLDAGICIAVLNLHHWPSSWSKNWAYGSTPRRIKELWPVVSLKRSFDPLFVNRNIQVTCKHKHWSLVTLPFQRSPLTVPISRCRL